MTKIRILKTQKSKLQNEQNVNLGDNIIPPPLPFDLLLWVFEESSNISGIIHRIAAKTAMEFAPTPSFELDRILQKIDIEAIALDMLVFGNAFFERLKNLRNEPILEFERILATKTFLAKKNSENIFAYFKENTTETPFWKSEILFFKRPSLSNKNYGDSLFSKSTNEIILLTYITKYFKKFFENGNINPTILFADGDKNALTNEQIDKLKSMINDTISGIDNADTTAFVGTKIGKIDLSTNFDPEKIIALKRELKEDIAISLNIPFDLISSQDSNRSTSDVAMRMLYSDIILPLQEKILKQLKKQLLTWFDEECQKLECWKGITREDIEGINFETINLNDPKAQMETLIGYKKEGVLNANEVRKMAGLWDDIEGGENYSSEQRDEKTLEKIRENIKKMYEWATY